jgi:hypothetical protein
MDFFDTQKHRADAAVTAPPKKQTPREAVFSARCLLYYKDTLFRQP